MMNDREGDSGHGQHGQAGGEGQGAEEDVQAGNSEQVIFRPIIFNWLFLTDANIENTKLITDYYENWI